jgi:hypothetical protein
MNQVIKKKIPPQYFKKPLIFKKWTTLVIQGIIGIDGKHLHVTDSGIRSYIFTHLGIR